MDEWMKHEGQRRVHAGTTLHARVTSTSKLIALKSQHDSNGEPNRVEPDAPKIVARETAA